MSILVVVLAILLILPDITSVLCFLPCVSFFVLVCLAWIWWILFSRWKSFKRQMLSMRAHSDSKGIELKRPNDSIYSFPCPDCMCRVNKTRLTSGTWSLKWRLFFCSCNLCEHLVANPSDSFIFFPSFCWREVDYLDFERLAFLRGRSDMIFYGACLHG